MFQLKRTSGLASFLKNPPNIFELNRCFTVTTSFKKRMDIKNEIHSAKVRKSKGC